MSPYISSQICYARFQVISSDITYSTSARMVRLWQQRQWELQMGLTAQPSKTNLTGVRNTEGKSDLHRTPINPNKPRILPNASTTRILTNKFGSAASARAVVEPAIPTQIPQRRLHAPTVVPPWKTAKPNGQEVRRACVVAGVTGRACEVVIASIHSRVRNGGQLDRIDNCDDLVRHSERIVRIGGTVDCAQLRRLPQLHRK